MLQNAKDANPHVGAIVAIGDKFGVGDFTADFLVLRNRQTNSW
jgi:hypothetical protein